LVIIYSTKKSNPCGAKNKIGEQPSQKINFTLNKKREMDFLKDLWDFMKERKKWWLLPIIIVLLLLGILIVIGGSSATAPFVYTLF
jgi:hypothetical protein